jgi:hypothetical protein
MNRDMKELEWHYLLSGKSYPTNCFVLNAKFNSILCYERIGTVKLQIDYAFDKKSRSQWSSIRDVDVA